MNEKSDIRIKNGGCGDMNDYEIAVLHEVEQWQKKIFKRSSIMNRMTKGLQDKINEKIPEKFHKGITEGMKAMVKATLVGSNFTTKKDFRHSLTLKERDEKVKELIEKYRKAATIEGAGTGAGGIFLGLADFPLLLQIKMKFLFEVATVYGYDVREYEERLFILHVFQLAFSSDEKRKETYSIIKHWNERKKELIDMDWQQFQQEYRDYIDFVKMFQLIPGFGAIVGAYANYNLLDHLGEVAKNCYRLRILRELEEKRLDY